MMSRLHFAKRMGVCVRCRLTKRLVTGCRKCPAIMVNYILIIFGIIGDCVRNIFFYGFNCVTVE